MTLADIPGTDAQLVTEGWIPSSIPEQSGEQSPAAQEDDNTKGTTP